MSAGAGQGGGRFAPSPTGPLHRGSLLAATASYLDARHRKVPWRVRFDDLDVPRNQPGAEAAILRCLQAHGLHWDGPVDRQSEHLQTYADALERLESAGVLFYCRCSRRRLRDAGAYPGTCRAHTRPRPDSAVRIRVDRAVIEFHDLIQGHQHQDLAASGGDFVVRRRDGIVAYQLATAVDDGAPDVARVIRGRDLLGTTPRQIFLMERLGLGVPDYGHIPLLLNASGQKLSKQTHAPPLNDRDAPANLVQVLRILGLAPDPDAAGCEALLAEAVRRFSLQSVSATDVRESGP